MTPMSKLRRSNWANMLIDDDIEDEFNPEIIEGDGIYGYDYYWYHEKFPKEWALSHKEGTGPSQCVRNLFERGRFVHY